MEEKGIILPELNCRTDAELPLPDCRQSYRHQKRRILKGLKQRGIRGSRGE
jgi:hypothetical protein